MEIGYNDISVFGMRLIRTIGELDFPKMKFPLSHEWLDKEGLDVDLTETLQEPRTISFEFIMSANSMSDLENQIEDLDEALTSDGLIVVLMDQNPTPYFLCLSGKVTAERLNGMDEAVIYSRINFDMIEPYPVGRYFGAESSNLDVSVTVSTSSGVLVDWGDGNQVEILGTSTVSHTYDSFFIGEFYVGVFGKLEDISTLTVTGLTEII